MNKLLLLLFPILLASCYARVPEKTGLEGKPVPDFTIRESDGTTYFKTNQIKSGTPFVLIYYSPSCVFSRAQIRELTDYIDNVKNIQFYLVTTASMEELKKFNSELKLGNYPNIISGQDYNNFFSDYYEVSGVPFIAIYGKDGKMKAAFEGKVSPRQIKNCSNT